MIELTESAWTAGAADTSWALADLRETGVALAIDDFGAGFSSLSRLPEIPDDPTGVAVLRAIVDLARAGNAELIARARRVSGGLTASTPC